MIKLTNDEYVFFLIKNLILKHFRNLSEEIADNLSSIETSDLMSVYMAQEQHKSPEISMEIKQNMDMLAEDLDVILDFHKYSIINQCQDAITKVGAKS